MLWAENLNQGGWQQGAGGWTLRNRNDYGPIPPEFVPAKTEIPFVRGVARKRVANSILARGPAKGVLAPFGYIAGAPPASPIMSNSYSGGIEAET